MNSNEWQTIPEDSRIWINIKKFLIASFQNDEIISSNVMFKLESSPKSKKIILNFKEK